MSKTSLFVFGLIATFCLGFASRSLMVKEDRSDKMRHKVTGIGGIFFKSRYPEKLNEWYKTHLGFDTTPYGTNFSWREEADSTKKGSTQWAVFAETAKYFAPSTKDFMVNYRIENLELLLKQLKNEGVAVVDSVETSDYGKFVHIMDPDGNKVELWEPK